MLGSVGVLISGVVTIVFGWRYADPLIGVAIGLFVLPRAYNLGRHAIGILLQQAPKSIDITEVNAALNALPGVHESHDLHVWTITSRMDCLSAHVVLGEGRPAAVLLTRTSKAPAGLNHPLVRVAGSDGIAAALDQVIDAS